MAGVFVSLGSNVEFARDALFHARASLERLLDCRVQCASALFLTEPQNDHDQPWFLNQVVELNLGSNWEPCSLLGALLGIEAALGRKREGARRYGPRVIDLDLLLFGETTLATSFCTLPHPRMHKRAFVLWPLKTIAPDLSFLGESIDAHLSRLTWHLSGARIFQQE